MNRLQTTYKGKLFKNITAIAFSNNDNPRFIRSFCPEFENEIIEIKEDIVFEPQYFYPDTDGLTTIHIRHQTDLGCWVTKNFNPYNSDCQLKFDSKEKKVIMERTIKNYCSNVLFYRAFSYDKIDRIEISETLLHSNLAALQKRYDKLLKEDIFDQTKEPLIRKFLLNK